MSNWAFPDPKPRARVRDADLLKALHLRWRSCAVCGQTSPRSLHHISKHPRDDVEGNLVMLCGSGTTGCHGLAENHDFSTLRRLHLHIFARRPDVLEYLDERFPQEGAIGWLQRTLGP